MRALTRLAVAAALVSTCALAAGPAALAAQAPPELESVQLGRARTSEPTGATVTASMDQAEYADISFNVAFQGFQGNDTFDFRPGRCPASLVRVSAPARVFKCGWEQRDGRVILRLALEGTFDDGTITVRLAPGSMTSPAEPGRYAVTLSGWSFPDVVGSVRVLDCGPRGDVTGC
ncbi:MAG: hypothetical protein Q8M17_15835 [Actinomycetota bacterium]|nr:hypothetical protein [Actinomycetota bacterium]